MFILFGLLITNSLYQSDNGSILIVFQSQFSSKNFVLFCITPFDAPASIEIPLIVLKKNYRVNICLKVD